MARATAAAATGQEPSEPLLVACGVLCFRLGVPAFEAPDGLTARNAGSSFHLSSSVATGLASRAASSCAKLRAAASLSSLPAGAEAEAAADAMVSPCPFARHVRGDDRTGECPGRRGGV